MDINILRIVSVSLSLKSDCKYIHNGLILQENRGFFYKITEKIAFFECKNRHLVQVRWNIVLEFYVFCIFILLAICKLYFAKCVEKSSFPHEKPINMWIFSTFKLQPRWFKSSKFVYYGNFFNVTNVMFSGICSKLHYFNITFSTFSNSSWPPLHKGRNFMLLFVLYPFELQQH